MESFAGKTVVITGGASGIGLGFAKAMGQEGARIVICDILQERINSSLTELADMGIEAAGQQCNVAEMPEVEALAEFAWDTFKTVDVVINGAGISGRGAVLDADRADIEKVLDVNFFGVWNGCKVFGNRFVDQGTPSAIYNIGSENSLYNFVPNAFGYEVSKHAVFSMTDALRKEVPDFIDVALICPGYVNTNMTGDAGLGMDVDPFVAIIIEQLKAGNFLAVSHAHNIVRIDERYNEIKEAYATYAPRYEGDEEYDVPTLMAKYAAQRGK